MNKKNLSSEQLKNLLEQKGKIMGYSRYGPCWALKEGIEIPITDVTTIPMKTAIPKDLIK